MSSYDAFGSLVLTPLGAAIAGPVAHAVGFSAAFWLAGIGILVCDLAMLLIPAVWAVRAGAPQPVAAAG